MRTTRIPAIMLAGTLLVSSFAIPAAQAAQQPVRQDAATILATLTVTPTQEDVPGYTQKSFNYPKHRADLGSKADQWDWVMTRDFDKATLKTTDGNVTYGELKNDPYSGQTITYEGKAGAVDIEHVVARSEAWDSGASKWTQEKRDEFANDPLETMAVSASGNRSHGEKDAAEWLPSSGSPLFPKGNPSYDCKYVARQIAVKAKYGLTVDRAEHDAMAKTLASCPTQTLPLDTDGEYWEDNPAPATPSGKTGDVDGDGEYTANDLTGVTAMIGGANVQGFTPTGNGEWTVTDPGKVTLGGLPDGWSTAKTATADGNGVTYTVTSPDHKTVATWTFRTGTAAPARPSYSAADLTGFNWVYEGKTLHGDGSFGVPDPSKVTYTGLPEGWTITSKTSASGSVTYTVCSPDGLYRKLTVFAKTKTGGAAAADTRRSVTVESGGSLSLPATGVDANPLGLAAVVSLALLGAVHAVTRRHAVCAK